MKRNQIDNLNDINNKPTDQQPQTRLATVQLNRQRRSVDDQNQSFTSRKLRRKPDGIKKLDIKADDLIDPKSTLNTKRSHSHKQPKQEHSQANKTAGHMRRNNTHVHPKHAKFAGLRQTRYLYPVSQHHVHPTTTKTLLISLDTQQVLAQQSYPIDKEISKEEINVDDFDKTIYESFYELLGPTKR
jgi:hypothetical protein